MLDGNCFEIEYIKKFPFVKIKKQNLFSIFFVSLIVGILAFFFETLIDYVNLNKLMDRGFLIGPFIPIYFFCTFFGLCYIKTPKANYKNFFLYVLIIGGGISLIEFIVGNTFELLFHRQLWCYDGFMPISYKYVSLTVGLLWGVLGTIITMFVIPFFKVFIDRINKKYQFPIVLSFIVAFVSDIIISFILMASNNWKYKELYEIEVTFELSMLILAIFILCLLLFNIFRKAYEIKKRNK